MNKKNCKVLANRKCLGIKLAKKMGIYLSHVNKPHFSLYETKARKKILLIG